MLNSLDVEGRPQDVRVVVAMSGGVDSSVTAALLKAQGYDVVGVTLQLYDHGAATHRKGACCAGQDIHDARMVAGAIGIPHYVLNYESRFKEAVIDRFAESYVAGETPVPCVDCNQAIKFRDLLTTARELGASVLATGHYVASRALPGGGRALYRARDEDRDQSYFLFATTREQIDFLRFPLGDLTKAETRELARRFALPVADKPDSQDICFVPTGRYADLIERLMPGAAEAGDIVDLGGRVLGRHAGIINFTVGQRRGLGHRRRRAALRGAARRRQPPRRGRPAAGTAHHAGASARPQLDRGGRARRRGQARRAPRRVRQGAFEPAAAAGMARERRGRLRGRVRRRRGGRRAGPGLRALRCRRRPGAHAGRRLHPFRGVAGRDRRIAGDGSADRAACGAMMNAKTKRSGAMNQDSRENPLDQALVEPAYARWAPVYDVVFGAVFAPGRAAGIKAAERIGGRILEVGVGTGISLPDYSRNNRLVGVDICEPMLRKAKERVAAQGLSHVEMLAVMDGTRLAFADASFDVVVAQFVITAVPDPEATLDEFARVVRPGGEIVLVNHFATDAEPLRTLERGFAPACPPPRLAAGIPVPAALRLGGAGGPAAARAPADPAARPVLAAALRQSRGVIRGRRSGGGPACEGGLGRGTFIPIRPHPDREIRPAKA